METTFGASPGSPTQSSHSTGIFSQSLVSPDSNGSGGNSLIVPLSSSPSHHRLSNSSEHSRQEPSVEQLAVVTPRQGSHSRTPSNISAHSFHSPDDPEEITLFTEPTNQKLFCLICKRVFRDPVITQCGHTYCKNCTVRGQPDKCPVDDVRLSVVVANLAVAEQVGELLIHCKYGCRLATSGITDEYEVDPTGCPMTLKVNARREHESECGYAPAACPNNPNCPPLRKMDLEPHLKDCNCRRCDNHSYGCSFVGTQQDLAQHLASDSAICHYQGIKEYLQSTHEKMNELQITLTQKDEEINFLRSMLGRLSERIDNMEKSTEVKLEVLDGNQNRLNSELLDTRHEFSQLDNEIQHLSAWLNSGAVGYSGDPQQIIKCKGTFVGHQGPVWSLCVYGDILFSGSADKSVKVWDYCSYNCLKTLEGHTGIVLALCTHGNKLYSGSQDKSIMVWDLEHLEAIKTIDAHSEAVCTLAAANNMLFSGSLKVIRVYDLHTHQFKTELTGLNHWVRALTVFKNQLYCGSFRTIQVYDLNTLDVVHVLETPGGSIYCIAISNHYIVAGTYENSIEVWDGESHQHHATLTGHSGTIYALAVIQEPGRTRVLSASQDTSVRVWNLENLICTQNLVRHQDGVSCLAISRGRVFSGSVDSTVKVWQ